MTDLEKLKKQVQEKEFPVGAKIKEGCIEIEVLNSIQEDGDMTIFLECNDCIFNDGICKGDISCSNFDREDNECVIFKQTTNGN
jgi:hypothetical protein